MGRKAIDMVRQGDVLVMRVAEHVATGAVVPREQGRVVLAHGEVTGHAHAISDEHATLYADPQPARTEQHLRIVQTSAWLRHEEHAPIELPPGLHRVRRQKEYTPERTRQVAD